MKTDIGASKQEVTLAQPLSWEPFVVCGADEKPPKPRHFRSVEGLGDRLRAAAFAEFQARRAFARAPEVFSDAPTSLAQRWSEIALDEQRHYDLIMGRMQTLGLSPEERPVSLALWYSLEKCRTAREFSIYIAGAEERGRLAGVAIVEALSKSDPETAAVFREIVHDEVEHVALADIYFGWRPQTFQGS